MAAKHTSSGNSQSQVGGMLKTNNIPQELDQEKDDFTARDYQVELLQAALDNDIIVYLPTGSGKTFIAALLIKEKSSEVTPSLAMKGRRTVFLVPTVVLAIQQANYLRRHTHLEVKEYYGSMGVDLWSKNQWEIEFESNNVLVMTAQIFVDILNHAYFFVNQVNLLIFDECHAAVKDAPMKMVLAKLDKCEKGHRPKILGLTAALFRKRCKPSQVRNVITQLSESMKCIVKTPSDIQTVYRNSTKPCEMILQYRDDDTAIQIADSRKLSDMIMETTMELYKELTTRYHRGTSSSPESSFSAKAEKTDMLFDPLNEMLFLLKAFGPYGAYHCAQVYIEILPGFKGRAKVSQLASDLDRVTLLCKRIRDQCVESFNKHSPKDRLLLFIQPRILLLLDLLRKFNPSNNTDGERLLASKNSAKLCGIVFVDRRCMANVLYHYLKDISRHDETLDFIKPLFTMGQASGRSSLLKESKILNMKQNEIMKQFREGLCNLLIATSVLEEGIDIPVCNVIIRFDKIRTYCDYVQTKGRARASKAFYCILVNEGDTEPCLQDLMEFHSIEQQLINTADFEEELEIDNLCNQIIHPYAPYGENGPRVTLQSSISLVNRYCGQLTTQEGLILAPKWMVNTVKASQVEPSWMRLLQSVISQLPDSRTTTHTGELYQCSILLPLNSPLREEIFGQVMPTKKLAKRAAALKMCIKLHELKELDDLHLLPIRQNKLEDVDTSIEEEEEAAAGPQTATNRGGFYDRSLPKCFISNRPSAGQPVFIYALEFKLTKPSESPSNGYFPFAVETKLAILSSCNIPAICPFPLVTKAGEFQVDLVGVDCVILTEDQLAQLEKFHRFIFQDVIYLFKKNLDFDPESSKLKYLIAPLGKLNEEYHIDLHFVDRIVNHKPIDWNKPPHTTNSYFHFDPAVYADAVIIPSYRPFGTLNTYYVDVVTDLIPSNSFPEIQYKDFTTYFRKKYKLTVTNPNQRLLQVSREISGKNFLVPRILSSKEDKTIFMVPEFCFVHPLPCSVWKQVVWLPSILHRLNGLLVADELRVAINKETKIGVEFLPGGVNVSTVWRPLTIRWKKLCPSKNDASTADPRLLLPTFKPMLLDLDSDMLSDLDMIWNIDYSTDQDLDSQKSLISNGSPQQRSSASADQLDDLMDLITFSDPVNSSSQWNERTRNISFDMVSRNSLSKFGPSPSLVLEALTLTKSNDGFDMERLETIGDSLLKLVIGIYVYGQTASKHLDEGRLSHMRMQQINNKHLYKLGQQKNLGQLISGQSFDLILNFLPPGFQAPVTENAGETNLHLQQYVSSKNIADSMEALMGVYLLSTGIKGAMMVMNWMGLKTVPDTANQVNEDNGFPVIQPSPLPTVSSGADENYREMLERLYAGLDSFEARLGYVFKNKLLLIEALTHASYFPNRLTDCYQRLEFLGDAVLDYLVTRFHYDNPQEYSPAELTDLRSAMVNNETFAAIAVRNNFHLYLKHQSLSLSVMVDGFVRAQEDNGHLLMHDYFVLEADELDVKMASNVDVPKVLGDIFESVAGAIFVDSGMSLDAVWRSYLRFLSADMEKLNQKIPRSPVRELHERFTSSVKFKKAVELPDGRLCVAIEFDGDQIFKGVGKNSKAAKAAAAKYALSRLNKKE